jgi:hypothetical protein
MLCATCRHIACVMLASGACQHTHYQPSNSSVRLDQLGHTCPACDGVQTHAGGLNHRRQVASHWWACYVSICWRRASIPTSSVQQFSTAGVGLLLDMEHHPVHPTSCCLSQSIAPGRHATSRTVARTNTCHLFMTGWNIASCSSPKVRVPM